VCLFKKETYYGFKLHALTTLDGYLTDFILTPVNIDDRAAVWDLTSYLSPVTIIGDKGYIGDKFISELKFEKKENCKSIFKRIQTNNI
jgi:hypothetical protein